MLENIFGRLYRFFDDNDDIKDEKENRKRKKKKNYTNDPKENDRLRNSSSSFDLFPILFQKRFQESIQRKDLLAVVPNFRIHVRVEE